MVFQLSLKKRLAPRHFHRRGATGIEYTLIAALIVTVLVLSVSLFSKNMNSGMGKLASHMGETDQKPYYPEDDDVPGQPVEDDSADLALVACFVALSLVSGFALVSMFYQNMTRKKIRRSDRVYTAKKNFNAMEMVMRKHTQFKRLLRDDLQDVAESLLEHCIVGNFMTEDVFTVAADLPLQEAREQLEVNQFRRVLVKNSDGTLAGVLSKKDIVLKSGKVVKDVMTDHPKTVNFDTKIHFALTVLLTNRISCLPVVDANRQLLGMISTSDLIIMLHCLLSVLHEKHTEDFETDTGESQSDDSISLYTKQEEIVHE